MKRLFPILFTIISLILIINLSRELIRVSKSGERLDSVAERLNQLKLENWKLKQESKYRQSPEFLEEQIRDKLIMGKAGETMVILPREEIAKIASQSAKEEIKEPLPVWQQWWELFK